jgi:thiamine kinase-like enzyme
MKIDDQILPYLQKSAQEALGVSDILGASIEKLPGGDYNYNYHVHTDGCDVVVRLNIEPQSGSDDQIAHEYKRLEFLAPYNVTPKPLFLDNSKKHFPYGLLVEEYIAGGHLKFSIPAIQRVASSMAVLHTIPVAGAPLERRGSPLRGQFESVLADLEAYKKRHKPNAELLRLARRVIDRIEGEMSQLESLYTSRSIIHTDPNPANIIDNGEKAYFIDWEISRIDDPSYDVAAFFSDALNLWASPRTLTLEEKQAFLEAYKAKTGDATIEDRLLPRVLLYTLNAVIWGAGRIADVDEGKIDPHLGDQNYTRYQKLADPEELEKVLAMRSNGVVRRDLSLN